MPDRATLQEVHEFANQVREAGGGNPIDALMPSVPDDPSACLIARNLNFNCEVNCGRKWDSYSYPDDNMPEVSDPHPWVMETDEETRDKIAAKLDLVRANDEVDGSFAVILPERIGQVASDFDKAGETLRDLGQDVEDGEYYAEDNVLTDQVRGRIFKDMLGGFSADALALAREMAPYIEESRLEAYSLATAVNARGEIIL